MFTIQWVLTFVEKKIQFLPFILMPNFRNMDYNGYTEETSSAAEDMTQSKGNLLLNAED